MRLPPYRVSQALLLYLVTTDRDDIVESIRDAVSAGVTMVQLRRKHHTDGEIVDLGRQVLPICRAANVPLIINDRLDIALVVGADGVHLGVDDLPVADARRLAEEDFLIGFSPETDAQIVAAASQGVSYLGIGPFFATSTKGDAGPSLGAKEFARRRPLTHLPVVAIGGIDADNAKKAIYAGADGVAVASAILAATDVGVASRRLRMVLDQ